MTITIESTTCFDGPTIWSLEPVIRLVVDFGPIQNIQLGDVRRIVDRLTDLLPLLVDPSPSNVPLDPVPFPGEEGLAALLGAIVLNLQRLAGVEVGFSFNRPADGKHEIVVQHGDEAVGVAASKLAVRLLNDLLAGDEPEAGAIQTLVLRFGTLAASRRGGTAARTIVAAARKRGIPVSNIDPSGRIIELGTGADRRRFQGSMTSLTPKIGDNIVTDKDLTNRYLRAAGLPVPEGEVARTVEQAVAAARAIGYPVVLKPVDFGASVGVFVDLRAEDQVRDCFASSAAASPTGRVLVERYIAGVDYRVLVVNDRVVAVSEHLPAYVTGDGRHSVRRLTEMANADPRRGPRETDPLKEIVIDATTMALLERAQLDLDAIPAAGRRVPLKSTGKIPHGGVAIDRTGDVHPDNAVIFRQAARVVGADVASLDVVVPDISESIWTTGGAILEVNLGSGFRNELYPAEGQSRDPGPAIVDMLFPPGQPTRAPIIAVAGDPQPTGLICHVIAHILKAAGASVGLATSAGLVVDGLRIRGDGARTLLHNPSTEVAVVEIDPREIVDRGLDFNYCDVAVITSLSGLATPFERPVETVLTSLIGPGGVLVLNADEPTAASLAGELGGSPVLFSLDANNGLVRRHVERGGRAVVVRQTPAGGMISLLAGVAFSDIVSVTERLFADNLPRELASLVLLAAAAAIARDVPIETIRHAMSSFA